MGTIRYFDYATLVSLWRNGESSSDVFQLSLIIGDRRWASVVTHELAHAWTGNLITNATWEDFWLNEGWTTYAETRITEILMGKEYGQLIDAASYTRLLDEMERFGMDSEITCLSYSQKGLDPDEFFFWHPLFEGELFFEIAGAINRPRKV